LYRSYRSTTYRFTTPAIDLPCPLHFVHCVLICYSSNNTLCTEPPHLRSIHLHSFTLLPTLCTLSTESLHQHYITFICHQAIDLMHFVHFVPLYYISDQFTCIHLTCPIHFVLIYYSCNTFICILLPCSVHFVLSNHASDKCTTPIVILCIDLLCLR
jgi:hypothetical protein